MGDPKFPRRLFDTPTHPWKASRIAEETELCNKHGLKNRKELWRIKTQLGKFRGIARSLQARIRAGDEQAEREAEELLTRLRSLEILGEEGTLVDVLSIPVETLLARRVQTQTYVRGFAGTPRQARQLIKHGHITLRGRKLTVPGYQMRKGEPELLEYHHRSPLLNEAHPARPRPKAAEEGAAAANYEEWAAKEGLDKGAQPAGTPSPVPAPSGSGDA